MEKTKVKKILNQKENMRKINMTKKPEPRKKNRKKMHKKNKNV